MEIAFHPDGGSVIICDTTSDPVELRRISIPEGDTLLSWRDRKKTKTIRPLAISSSGGLVAGAKDQTSIRVWDCSSGERVGVVNRSSPGRVFGLSFSADDRLLAVGEEDGTVRLFETHSWSEAATLDWGLDSWSRVVFAPDGLKAVALGECNRVVLWDLE